MTMTLIVPVLTFITTGLFVFALAPQQRISIRRRLAPYGSNVPAARDRLLGASFIDRVLVPAVKGTARLATLIAPSSIRAKAVAELAQAGDPMSVDHYMALRLVAMIGAPVVYVLYLTQSGETISALGLVLIAVLFIAGGRFSSWWVRRAIKRRQELANSGVESREVLRMYSVELIDRYAEMSATGALIFYSLFVMSANARLVWTIPLVIFGLYRYWYVVESLDGGESPTDAVLTDLPLAIAILIWVGVCVIALTH